ncbi:MAG: hypothetical protein JJT77_00070 [Crocinitomicaceae bacterium]|nr:hypothetical protein [Crocinitomicaceae bacterium]
MKANYILMIVLFGFLLSNCGVLKRKTQTLPSEDFVLIVECFVDVMPGVSETPKLPYVVIAMRRADGKPFENNWKIKEAVVRTTNGNILELDEMDQSAFSGKNQLEWRNNLRNVPEKVKEKFDLELTMLNDAGNMVTLVQNDIVIMMVH